MELTAAEGRVLACLIEKEATAADAYPLTLNALRLACNQSTQRDEVVAYDDRTVEDTLLSLKSKGLARFTPPATGERTTRYSHRADDRWRMGRAELAVLSVLLLRGVQTVSEVRANAGQLIDVTDPGEVEAVLDALAARTPTPFAARLDRLSADGETRWLQVLTGPPPSFDDTPDRASDAAAVARSSAAPAPPVSPSTVDLARRLAELEQRLAAALERPAPTPNDRRIAPVPPPPPPGDGQGLAERVTDIERRLARIEAELGALR